MKTLQELQPMILAWANERNLLKADNSPKQRLKLLEEVGETAKAILKNDIAEQKDGLGDIFVVLVILAEQLSEPLDFDLDDHSDNQNKLKTVLDCAYGNNIYFVLNYLNETALFLNHDLTECANLAWNEIKDRKGKTIDGTFIKNDLQEYCNKYKWGDCECDSLSLCKRNN